MHQTIKSIKQDANSSEKALIREINDLQKSVDSFTIQNFKTLAKIQQIDPDFDHQLYQPKSLPGKQVAFKKQLLLKQVDRLLQEKTLLDKKLQNFSIPIQQTGQFKDQCIMRQSTQYAFLRTVWSKFHQSTSADAIERVQQLNKAVCTFRNNIVGITNREKTQPFIPQNVKLEHVDYTALKQKYERVCMKYQDLCGKTSQNSDYITHIKGLNQEYKRQIQLLKRQSKKAEGNILKYKIQLATKDENLFRLTCRIKQLEKHIAKVTSERNLNEEQSLTLTGLPRENSESAEDKASWEKSTPASIIFFNRNQALKIKIFSQKLNSKRLYNEISTTKSLLDIMKFFDHKLAEQQAQTESDFSTDPNLLFTPKPTSPIDDFSERTRASKQSTQRESLNLTCSHIPKTHRRLMSCKDNVPVGVNTTGGGLKKFARTGAVIYNKGFALNQRISAFQEEEMSHIMQNSEGKIVQVDLLECTNE